MNSVKIYQIVSFDTETDAFESVEGTDLKKVLSDGYEMYLRDFNLVEDDLDPCDFNGATKDEWDELIMNGGGPLIPCVYSHISYDLNVFELPLPSKISIPLASGKTLTAEAQPDPSYKEIFVYLEDDGLVTQDLAIIGEEYIYKEAVDDIIPVEKEDFTVEYKILEYEEEE